MDISLILPAYNESTSIAGTIGEISRYFQDRSFNYEIIVAADGDDGTRDIVSQLARSNSSVKVIGHVERRGKGLGVREAVALSAGEIVGYVDADNKVDIREFEKLEPFLQEGYHVVFGSRGFHQSLIERQQPWFRRLGSRGFGLFMHAVVGLQGIKDTQCGFKFFSREAAFRIFGEQKVDGYMFDVEILKIAQNQGWRLKEVPIRWRDDGDSRLELVRGNVRNAIDIFKIRQSSRRAHRLSIVAKVSEVVLDDREPH
ncbi:MAG TPA: dolichyl-phosphate beta-glucosyltransferase [Terriglobales bacterium]